MFGECYSLDVLVWVLVVVVIAYTATLGFIIWRSEENERRMADESYKSVKMFNDICALVRLHTAYKVDVDFMSGEVKLERKG